MSTSGHSFRVQLKKLMCRALPRAKGHSDGRTPHGKMSVLGSHPYTNTIMIIDDGIKINLVIEE